MLLRMSTVMAGQWGTPEKKCPMAGRDRVLISGTRPLRHYYLTKKHTQKINFFPVVLAVYYGGPLPPKKRKRMRF
jgi:hypothetical protein